MIEEGVRVVQLDHAAPVPEKRREVDGGVESHRLGKSRQFELVSATELVLVEVLPHQLNEVDTDLFCLFRRGEILSAEAVNGQCVDLTVASQP